MKRCQYITKLQHELIQEKKFIDKKLDEAIVKHCYLEKTKYELLPQVVIPKTQQYTQYPSHHLIQQQKQHYRTSYIKDLLVTVSNLI